MHSSDKANTHIATLPMNLRACARLTLHTGAIHCQILDAIYPGKVPLHKVNFDATQEYQFVQNYKILQSVFNKENITKHVDVQKLIKAKYQDNLEFLQWMKHFFESTYGGQEYNAKERREQAIRRFGSARNKGKAVTKRAPRAAPKSSAEAKSSSSTSSSSSMSSRTKTETTTEKKVRLVGAWLVCVFWCGLLSMLR